MIETQPKAIFRKDYRVPSHWIESTRLEFDLGEEFTTVRADLSVKRNPDSDATELVLAGEELETISIRLDGRTLESGEYTLDGDRLRLPATPDAFRLETEVRIRPQDNTSLSGLYKSSGNFCTQCEAEGFRRITWFLDRPDVMSTVTRVTVTGGSKRRIRSCCRTGTAIGEAELDDGRHRGPLGRSRTASRAICLRSLPGTWPPTAGDLHVTASGREVQL